MNYAFYFIPTALFILKIFNLIFVLTFLVVGKYLEEKARFNFNIYGVTSWETNNYNTHVAVYLKK